MRRMRLGRAGMLTTAAGFVLVWATGDAGAQPAESTSPAEAPLQVVALPPDGETIAEKEPAEAERFDTIAAPPRLVGNPENGATKAAVCGACHGPDGNAIVPLFPKLAGQRSDYIAKQLRDFKAGVRVDPVMAGMAAMLSDQDIADVALHFERGSVSPGTGDEALATTGERIYRKGRPEIGLLPCIGCHGPNGEGANGAIDGGFPAVSGQHPDYLVKQLQSFRVGSRTNDWQGIMQIIAARLSDEDIASLTAYLSQLPRSPK